MEKLREDTILNIRSCLGSMKGSCDLRQLSHDFVQIVGNPIKYADLGYANLEEFIWTVPTLNVRRMPNGQVLVDAKQNELSSDITYMVAKQKPKKKKPSFRSTRQNLDTVVMAPQRWRPKNLLPQSTTTSTSSKNYSNARLAQLWHNQFTVRTPDKSLTPSNTNHQQQARTLNNNNASTLPKSKSPMTTTPQIRQPTANGKAYTYNHPAPTTKVTPPPSQPHKQHSPIKAPVYVNHRVFDNDVVRSVSAEKQPNSEKTNRAQLFGRMRPPPADSQLQKEALAAVNVNDPIWTEWTSSDSDTDHKTSDFFVSGDAGKDLWNYTRFRRIAEPETIVKVRQTKPHRNPIYDCVIKVDGTLSSSYPEEFVDEQSAIKHVSQKALAKLIAKYGITRKLSLLTSTEKDIVERIPSLVRKHYNGVWSWQVEADYKDQYREALPTHWLRIVDASPVISVEAFTNKHVLKYCNPADHLQKGKTSRSALAYDVSIPTSSAQFDVNGLLMAKITCPVSAEEVWCRQLGVDETEAFEKMYEKMERFYNEAYESGSAQPANHIVKGSYYAAWNINWYRVRALDVSDDGVQCLFVDRGDVLKVPKENIYNLQREYARERAQAFICRLAGLEDLYEISINSDHLVDLEGVDVTLEAVDADDQDQSKILTVVMYDAETGVSINEKLLSLISIENATPVLDSNTPLDVHISHVTPTGKLYVQIRKPGFIKLTSLLSELESTFPALIPSLPKQEPITRDNCQGKLFYGKLPGDTSYHRLRIIDSPVNFQFAQMQYVDIGKTAVVKMSEVTLHALEDINSVISRYPEQAVPVKMQLDRVPADFATKMAALVPADCSVLMRIERRDGDDVHLVKLFVRHPNIGLVSVNDSLAMEERNRQSPSSHMQETLDMLVSLDSPTGVPSTGRLPAPKLPATGEFYDVRVPFAVNPWNFFVQPLDHHAQLNELMAKMQVVYASKPKEILSTENLKTGHIYASKYTDDIWYRTSVLKIIHPGSISVFYVDYGYYANLKLQDLATLHKEFLELPYQAIKAKLSGIKPTQEKWTVDDCKYFQKLVEKREYVSVMMSIEKDELYTCDNVLRLKLIDTTTTKQDVHISDLLIQKRIAVRDGN